MSSPAIRTIRLGAVSFLNTRPLIHGLESDPAVCLIRAAPSRMADLLRCRQVDAALLPVVDLARGETLWRRVGDAGIVCRGETLTVRVFSRVPPERLGCLHIDGDSRTSVILARLIWRRWFEQPIRVQTWAGTVDDGAIEALLLIGDKVVAARPSGFPHEVDLGTAWWQWTGLPFVFAVWAAAADHPHPEALAGLLARARDAGTARAADLAERHARAHGWPMDLAIRYLTGHMQYRLTDEAVEGMNRFLQLARQEGLLDPVEELVG